MFTSDVDKQRQQRDHRNFLLHPSLYLFGLSTSVIPDHHHVMNQNHNQKEKQRQRKQ